MSKTRKFTLIEKSEYLTPYYQSLLDEDYTEVFSASDLSECPEDCTLTRDLFTAYDYIDAVEFGMRLAQEGYTEIEVEKVEEDE